MKKIILFSLFISSIASAQSGNDKMLVDLRGNWKFEIGDNKNFSDPNFDDRQWSSIFVPADWENEGFPGYDGYAWYRNIFTVPLSAENKNIFLHLGNVDDVCAVYVNGTLIGEGGQFPPHFETAYDKEQIFSIPRKFLNFGKNNVVAVRVYDSHLNGGIVKGKVGLMEHSDELQFLVTFPDQWKFKTGDNDEWKNPSFDDSRWTELIVPAIWDFQGYRDYDGFAWYRVEFDVPQNVTRDDLILMLGRIDDIDEAYLNGDLIGKTGRIRSDGSVSRIRNEYLEVRAYDIPQSLLQRGKKNVLAVRVYDNFQLGGIYEGPVGVVTKKDFRRWDRKKERMRWDNSPVDEFFNKFFNEK